MPPGPKPRHGHASRSGSTREFRTWSGMKERCSNPRNPSFSHYGGRGITVCEWWLKFDNFLADMGLKPPGMSIERIDNDGDYEPGNCRWATTSEQSRNKTNNVFVTFRGQTLIVKDWAYILGIKADTIEHRLSRGFPVERALSANDLRRIAKEEK
jgi:hypothetical protein